MKLRIALAAATAMALERERIEAVLPKGVRIIALDERGKDLTSVGLSQQLMAWQVGQFVGERSDVGVEAM